MKIIIDEHRLSVHEGCFIVKDDASFVEARQRVLNYKLDGQNGTDIAVITHPHAYWFFDLSTELFIKIETLLPSKLLRAKHKTIDEELTENDIVLLGLLNETIEPTEFSLVSKFIGPFLLKEIGLKELLYHATLFVGNQTTEFKNSLYLKKKWFKYFERLENDNHRLQGILAKVKEVDTEFCSVLHQLIYISNSNFLFPEFIHDNRAFLESEVPGCVGELEIFLAKSKPEMNLDEKIETQLFGRYKSLYRIDRDCFFRETGGYKASLMAFLSLSTSLTNEQKEYIDTNYRSHLNLEIESKLKALIKPELLPPPVINDLTLYDQIQAWQKWAVNSFIPYKFYLDEAKTETDLDTVEEYANRYSDWLFQSYGSIIQNEFKTNFSIPSLIRNSLDDFRVIWLIIDGFSAAYTELLEAILKNNGINKFSSDLHIAALPTITAIGIPTQLNGKTPESETYTKNRDEALQRSFLNQKVVFKNAVADFQQALDTDFDICCLHWKDIDKFMHKDDNEIEGRRRDEVKRLLEKRIGQVATVMKSNYEKKMKLFISTDHGATKCLTRGKAIKNSYLLEASQDNPKERCIELNDTITETQFDLSEVYYLKAKEAHNQKDWAIARGYRYFGRFDYGYRHGGLTPEETIVPFLECEISEYKILPVEVNYGGMSELRLGFTENLSLVIKNANDCIVHIEKVSVAEDRNASIVTKEDLQPFSSKTYEGKIKLPKTTHVIEGKARLNILISYLAFGEKQITSAFITVPIKKSVNESLDNLFS